jgi:hypothetical protein
MSDELFDEAVELYVKACHQQVRVLHQPSRNYSEYDERAGKYFLADVNALLAIVDLTAGAVQFPGLQDTDECIDWRSR